jgi:hypothetical protein
MTKAKLKNKIKKQYSVVIIIALLLTSALFTGYYFGDVFAKKPKEQTQTPKINDTRGAAILSDLMDQTVASCYYDLHQQNETTVPMNADICNHAMSFFKQNCHSMKVKLDSCDSDFFKLYLKGMEG